MIFQLKKYVILDNASELTMDGNKLVFKSEKQDKKEETGKDDSKKEDSKKDDKLVQYVVEKGTPVLEKAAVSFKKSAIAVTKDILAKLEQEEK